VEAARAQVMRLIVRHGELEGLAGGGSSAENPGPLVDEKCRRESNATRIQSEKSDWKPLLGRTPSGRSEPCQEGRKHFRRPAGALAVTKFLRTEMNQQFAQVLERCRVLLKNYEGIRQGKGVEYRERVAAFQVRKKDHPAQDRAGSFRNPARDREGNAGAHAAVVIRRSEDWRSEDWRSQAS
jgi:hypothetical protein